MFHSSSEESRPRKMKGRERALQVARGRRVASLMGRIKVRAGSKNWKRNTVSSDSGELRKRDDSAEA